MLTESFWNHCGMFIAELDEAFRKLHNIPYCADGYIIEALGNGVVANPVTNYIGNKRYILKIMALRPGAFKDQQEYEQGLATFISRMKEAIGKKYDCWGIVYLGFAYIFKAAYKEGRKYIPVGNPLQSRNAVWCSEVICEACHKISSLFDYLFQGKTKQKCDTTTPKDIGKSQNVKFKGGYDAV